MAAVLAPVAIGLTLLGTFAGMQGAKETASANASAYNYNAAISEMNANVARQQAQADAVMQSRETYKKLGAARASYGASGVTKEGSPLDVLAAGAEEGELARQNILYQGEVRATGYGNEANLQRFAARNAIAQGKSQSSQILLSGVTKAVTMGAGGAGSALSFG